jgi:hypothetical protein
MSACTIIQQLVDLRQAGTRLVPVIQRVLEGRSEVGNGNLPREIARHHDQASIATSFQRRKFHALMSLASLQCVGPASRLLENGQVGMSCKMMMTAPWSTLLRIEQIEYA